LLIISGVRRTSGPPLCRGEILRPQVRERRKLAHSGLSGHAAVDLASAPAERADAAAAARDDNDLLLEHSDLNF
jgi:hypothetical protein